MDALKLMDQLGVNKMYHDYIMLEETKYSKSGVDETFISRRKNNNNNNNSIVTDFKQE